MNAELDRGGEKEREQHASFPLVHVGDTHPIRDISIGEIAETRRQVNGRPLPEGVTITLNENSQEILENSDWQEEDRFSLLRQIDLKAEKDGLPYGILTAKLLIDKKILDKEFRETDRYVYLSRVKVQGKNEPADSAVEVGEIECEDIRKQGIGSSLLNELEMLARQFGASRIEGKVLQTDIERTQGLLEFYERRDFEILPPVQKGGIYRIVKWLQGKQPLPSNGADTTNRYSNLWKASRKK